MYKIIANLWFRKMQCYLQHRQIVDLAFKMNKLKTKYNALAQCKLEKWIFTKATLPYTKEFAGHFEKDDD